MHASKYDSQTDMIIPHNTEIRNIKKTNEKKVYLESIRAFSMLLVIFNHTGTRGFFLFSIANYSSLYPIYLFISVACKIAVPLYWMISGALLLPKNESIKRVYLHRVLRMVLVLVIFSLFYYIREVLKNPKQLGPSSVFSFFIRLYSDRFATAFWFIYAYIGILMILPFLRKLVRNMPKSYFHYLFLLVLFFRGVFPILEYLASTLPAAIGLPFNTELKIYSINSNVTCNIFSQAILYFLGGYYFDYLLSERELTKLKAMKWLGVGLVAIVITCFITHYKIVLTGLSYESEAQTFYNNLICLPTFAVFYSTRLLFQEHYFPDSVKRILLSFGQCTFGIMLLEEALREELLFIYNSLVPTIHTLPACIVWVLEVYLTGYIVTLGLKKIPGIRSLI